MLVRAAGRAKSRLCMSGYHARHSGFWFDKSPPMAQNAATPVPLSRRTFMTTHYLDDFAPGQVFRSGTLRVEADEIKEFAARYDPQPFHLDDEAARASMFQGLAASGWHTAALTMRLLVEGELEPAGGIVGAGFEDFRWLKPVRPGDVLHLESEIVEVRPSKSRPEQGLIKVRTTTFNQDDEPVLMLLGTLVVPRRSAS